MIDLNYYVENSILGIMARFISYMSEFEPSTSIDDEKEEDSYIINQAKKYLLAKIRTYQAENSNFIDNSKLYKNEYRRIRSLVKQNTSNKHGALKSDFIDLLDKPDIRDTLRRIENMTIKKSKSMHINIDFAKLLAEYDNNIFKMKMYYSSNSLNIKERIRGYRTEEDIIKNKVNILLPVIGLKIRRYYDTLDMAILDARESDNYVDLNMISSIYTLTDEETDGLKELEELYNKWVCMKMNTISLMNIIDEVKRQVDITIKNKNTIQSDTMNNIATNTSYPVLDDYTY